MNAFGAGIMCEPLRPHSLQLPKSEGGAAPPDGSVALPSAEALPQAKAKATSKPKPKAAGENAGRKKILGLVKYMSNIDQAPRDI